MDDNSAKPSAPEPHADPTPGGSYYWALWALFFVLVLYPLSIGPAARIHEKYPAARPVIEIIYLPLTTLIDHSQPTANLSMWYVMKVWKAYASPPTNAPAKSATPPRK
jgi:hypothetical protein